MRNRLVNTRSEQQPKRRSTKREVVAFDTKCARKLAESLIEQGVMTEGFKISKWSNEFRILRNNLHVDERRAKINKVLEWYLNNHKRDYVPQVKSAESFRKKFNSIVRSMEAHGTPFVKVLISSDTRFIVDHIQDHPWPKALRKCLPILVEQSLQRYTAVYNHVRNIQVDYEQRQLKYVHRTHESKEVRTKLGKLNTMIGFIKRAIGTGLSPPIHFIEVWFHESAERYLKRNELDAQRYTFRVNSQRFEDMGYEWANDYALDSDLWDTLMQRIRNESRETRGRG